MERKERRHPTLGFELEALRSNGRLNALEDTPSARWTGYEGLLHTVRLLSSHLTLHEHRRPKKLQVLGIRQLQPD